ncbi:uncharacterized protein PGTG_21592 [Puccinia graminis f. sp. tritici CRL 75-36-700-3]|uniref:Uncharacterized protein n=1 Tax=Puccinia graminis f. sp. tritici (strain CRL 75-36-700-3 / race SCCL) TaxID=418459 RepID=H6QRX7_PUCGT|nr:uncharacterized protein PGTG_21592 [Puccinia graminis f. sp. tritici CRL 75-36-700-3]EHS63461.1 hypothetical protein PGTG_21592 [Puccinia graminis f. sp. tritici CRL 75-36-700-3]
MAVVTGVGGFVAYHATRALINLAHGDSDIGKTSQQASPGADNGINTSKD